MHAPTLKRSRLVVIVLSAVVAEISWTSYIGWRLPRHYVANHWDFAWVGIDLAQIVLLLGVAWAAWRRRALLILFSTMSGTLLLVDAWFDVTTARRGDVGLSWLMALALEVPSALFFFWLTRRSIRQLEQTFFHDERIASLPVRKIPLPEIE